MARDHRAAQSPLVRRRGAFYQRLTGTAADSPIVMQRG
jgi:outer membrane scaffolding protein for murein synthesis (MipA/OmpV family)